MTNPSSAQPTPERPEEGATAAGAPAAARPAPAAHEERFGPLSLQRTRKDDGRLLIVFREAKASGE